MAYTASQNPKTGTTYTVVYRRFFATLILFCRNRSARHAPSGGVRETPLQQKRPLLRKLAVNPFNLVYTYDAERDIVFIEAQFTNAPPGSRDPRTYRTYVRCFCCVIVSARARHVVKSAFEQSGQQCLA